MAKLYVVQADYKTQSRTVVRINIDIPLLIFFWVTNLTHIIV